MFSKLLGKIKSGDAKEHQNQSLVDKISKMNLTDMRNYITNKHKGFKIDEEGLFEVVHKLIRLDENTAKRYIEVDDMDSKIKKGFDLILAILGHKKITVTTIELANEFVKNSADVIQRYDKTNGTIYKTKLNNAISNSIDNISLKAKIVREVDFSTY